MPPIPNLSTCKKLGFIVPSSNTVLEPYCNAIIASLNSTASKDNQLLCLYTRIRVKTVGTDASSTSQFSTETMVEAAQLLADAECDAILWNGTSGMWVGTGLAEDQALAEAMTTATGIPCSTTTLATIAYLQEKQYTTISLAVPYTAALTQKLIDFFTSCNFRVLRAERLYPTPGTNLEIGKCPPHEVEQVIDSAIGGASEDEYPDAVVVACTNWPGAGVVQKLEYGWGDEGEVIDSVTVTVWYALQMIRYKGGVDDWGRMLEDIGRA